MLTLKFEDMQPFMVFVVLCIIVGILLKFVFFPNVDPLGESDRGELAGGELDNDSDEDYITYPVMRNKKKIEKFVERCKL